MKILFLCNTLYQIIVASCIRNMFSDSEADIILSDHSTGNKQIYENYCKSNVIFTNVFYAETKHFYEDDRHLTRKQYWSKLKDKASVLSVVKLSKSYDMFFCANEEPFSIRLINYLKRCNSKVQINWFEDGLSAYDFDKIYFKVKRTSFKEFIRNCLGIYRVTTSVRKYFVFKPENMDWEPPAEIVKINPLDSALAKNLAKLFNFENCEDKYEEKYIFFEDGARDWNDSTDVELMQRVADIIGKDNIIVKVHPRNPENRFAKLGFKTNKNTSVPWEIIASNIDIENKVLITMFSQSVITPDILMNKKSLSLILANLEKSRDKSLNTLFDYMQRHYFSVNRDNYKVPENTEELERIIKEKGV